MCFLYFILGDCFSSGCQFSYHIMYFISRFSIFQICFPHLPHWNRILFLMSLYISCISLIFYTFLFLSSARLFLLWRFLFVAFADSHGFPWVFCSFSLWAYFQWEFHMSSESVSDACDMGLFCCHWFELSALLDRGHWSHIPMCSAGLGFWFFGDYFSTHVLVKMALSCITA